MSDKQESTTVSTQAQLVSLEDDDEFEEFNTGLHCSLCITHIFLYFRQTLLGPPLLLMQVNGRMNGMKKIQMMHF